MSHTPAYVEIPAEEDIAALRLQGLRKRGSGISIRTTRAPTTGRMNRILKLMGLTPTMHGQWCGFPLKEWVRLNPKWSEQDWARLVAENFERISSL